MADLEEIRRIYSAYDNNTPLFNMDGIKCYGRVVDVYDGDTIKIILPVLGINYYRFPARLLGIDTCEMTSKDDNVRQLAVRARTRLIQLITGDTTPDRSFTSKKEIAAFLSRNVYLVWVECGPYDKWGRVLVRLSSGPDATETFSQTLMRESLACEYTGGTKLTEAQQLTLMFIADDRST